MVAVPAVAAAAVEGGGGGDGGYNGGHGGYYPGWRNRYYGYGWGGYYGGFYDPFWPYPYYYPYAGYGLSYGYYQAPPPVVNVLPPEDYLDPPVDGGAPQELVWYYCEDPAGYYPYVRSCNAPWQEVPAAPPGAQQGDAGGEAGQSQQVGSAPGN